MKVARGLEAFLALRAELSGKIGFVPTMGALHEGHLSLVRLAKEHAESVIASVYVNPTQFAPHEDFDAYPRDVETDLAMLEQAGVDLVYLPEEQDIYPSGPEIRVRPGAAGEGLETDFRPHFFSGVATVVSRFFEIVKPDIAVFGEKDYQQLMVIREMVEREGFDIEILGGPIARDEHGLALSSRNAYLSEDELEIARMLNQILYHCASSLRAPDRSRRGQAARSHPESEMDCRVEPTALLAMTEEAKTMILNAGFDKVDYVEQRWGRVLVAAWLGKTRLIDNCTVILTQV